MTFSKVHLASCSPSTFITRTRKLPIKGEVRVRRGDVVARDTVVATAEIPGSFKTVNAASALGVAPARLSRVLGVAVGTTVKEGDILGETRALFGLIHGRLFSPSDGIIDDISTITGQIVIAEPPTPLNVPAYLEGEVVDVIPESGVEIAADAAVVQGIFGIGGETFGVLRYVDNAQDADKSILESDRGRVLVFPGPISHALLKEMTHKGVSGVVAAAASGPALIQWVGRSLNPAATGNENTGLTVVLTEGFGEMEMAAPMRDILHALDGKRVSLSGVTQVRAGVIRPELLGPPLETDDHIDADNSDVSVDIGTAIRIVRGRFFGRTGTISAIPPALRRIPSGAMASVFEVTLTDGDTVVVPRANIERG